ncbi:hypothetical protein ABK040_008903 [Willaertia magna]
MKYCANKSSKMYFDTLGGKEEEEECKGMKLYTTAIHKKRFHSTIVRKIALNKQLALLFDEIENNTTTNTNNNNNAITTNNNSSGNNLNNNYITELIESSCSSAAVVSYDPTNIKVIDKENIELASKLVQLFIPIIEINYNEKCLALQTSEKDIIYKEIIKTSEFRDKIRENSSSLQFYHFSKNDTNFLQRNIIGIIYKSFNGVVTCYFTALEKISM